MCRADHSSRRILPTVVRRWGWSRNLVNEDGLTQCTYKNAWTFYVPFTGYNSAREMLVHWNKVYSEHEGKYFLDKFFGFLISNFRRVLNVVCFLLGNSPVSEIYMPTFRNTLSVPYSYLPAYEDGTECSETSTYQIQTPGNYPEESIQRTAWFVRYIK
jgi:hypothetical protein